MFLVQRPALKSSAGCLKYEMTFFPQLNWVWKYYLMFMSDLDPGNQLWVSISSSAMASCPGKVSKYSWSMESINFIYTSSQLTLLRPPTHKDWGFIERNSEPKLLSDRLIHFPRMLRSIIY